MLKNYLKIALRNIKRHKGYSFINITGLAIGMACCLFITIWVLDELSYDKFHENAANLYRIETDTLNRTPWIDFLAAGVTGASGHRFRYHPVTHSDLIRSWIPGHPVTR